MLRAVCHRLILFVAALLLLPSCIRDTIESCPPLRVMIAVEDKNYENIGAVELHTGLDHRVDETMNFGSYVKKLFYVMYNLDTGERVLLRRLHDVTGDALMATVYLPDDLPFGRYGLVVWGNILGEEGLLSDSTFVSYDLHRNHVEGYDVYMSADELVYDEENYDYVVKLKRLKGKLIIQAENFPDEIHSSEKEVSGVAGNVDVALNYTEPETVVTYRTWNFQPGTGVVSHTSLSPSIAEDATVVEAYLFGSADTIQPLFHLQPVKATIHRNEITVLRYVYDASSGHVDAYIFVDDGWDKVVNLGIE